MEVGIVLLIAITIILVLLLTRASSSYAPGTPSPASAALISQPVFDSQGNYQDINPAVAPWTTSGNYTLDLSGPTWSQANINCWKLPNCVGIRHNFDTHQTWYLNQPIGTTSTSAVSVNTPNVQFNGQNYTLPLSIVALRSTQNPTLFIFSTVGTASWTVPAGVTSVKVLVVAGGGGGGGGAYDYPGILGWTTYGGAGGGGGVIYNASYSVTPGASIPITVGAGGGGAYNIIGLSARLAANGGNSVFGSLTAVGGGSGGSGSNGGNGGSGGGGGWYSDLYNSSLAPRVTNYTGGTGTSGQGYQGADGQGGGGGAGGPASGGTGGAGYTSSISGSSYTYSPGGSINNGANATVYGGGGGSCAPYNGTNYLSPDGDGVGSVWDGGSGYQGIVIVSF